MKIFLKVITANHPSINSMFRKWKFCRGKAVREKLLIIRVERIYDDRN